MKIQDITIEKLTAAPWNANVIDSAGIGRLKESLSRYGLVVPLVVRPIQDSGYEVLSGNQRLKAIAELELKAVPCVIVNLKDAEAMLLAQALNTIHGDDDPVMKGKMFEKILTIIPKDKVLSLLPETAESLKSATAFNESDLAEHLKAWSDAQAVRLKHMTLQFTESQQSVVEEALARVMPNAKRDNSVNPNNRGTAIFLLCKYYLDHKEGE